MSSSTFDPSQFDLCAIDVHQFSIITELLGTPPEDVIQTIASENVRFSISFETAA